MAYHLKTNGEISFNDGDFAGSYTNLGDELKLADLNASDPYGDLEAAVAAAISGGWMTSGDTSVVKILEETITEVTTIAAASGEANTASNAGSGTSLFYQKNGVDLEFNGIKSENNLLTVSLDGVSHDIELTVNEGNIDHGNLEATSLTHDDHTQYALLAGRAGGQTLIGGTGSGDDLVLESTSHGTKGVVQIQSGTDLDLNSNQIKNLAAGTAGTDAVNKNQLDNAINGLHWLDPVSVLKIKSDATQAGSPPTAGEVGEAWVVDTWGGGYTDGDIVEWDGASWNVIVDEAGGGEPPEGTRAIVIDSGAAGAFAGEENEVATFTSSAWSFGGTPSNGDAVLVSGDGSEYENQGFTYDSTPGEWVQFAGSTLYTAGTGINIAGSVISVSGWSLDHAYDAGSTVTVDSGAIELNGSNAADYTLEVTNTANGGALFVNNSGSGNTVDFQDSSSSVFTIDGSANLTTDLTAVDIQGSGAVTIDSSGGTIGIGTDDVDQNINIGTQGERTVNVSTGAFASTVNIGNTTGATAVNLDAGTGGIALTSTGTGDITLDSDDTLLLDADGVLELNSSGGAINVGNDDVDQAINIGTSGERPITIGNTTGATAVSIDVPSGGFDINGTTGVSGIIDDDTMASASAVTLATSESIKAYVDSQVSASDTLAEVYANAGNSVTMSAANGSVVWTGAANQNGEIMRFVQADTSNNPNAIEISNAGSGAAISLEGAGSRLITSDSGNLDITTTTSGDININSVADLDLDGATVAIDSAGTLSLQGAGATDLTCTSGTLTIENTDTTLGHITMQTADGTTGIITIWARGSLATGAYILVKTDSDEIKIDSGLNVDVDAVTSVELTAGTSLDLSAGTAFTIDADDNSTMRVLGTDNGAPLELDIYAQNSGTNDAKLNLYTVPLSGETGHVTIGGNSVAGADWVYNIGVESQASIMTIGATASTSSTTLQSGTGGVTITATSSDVDLDGNNYNFGTNADGVWDNGIYFSAAQVDSQLAQGALTHAGVQTSDANFTRLLAGSAELILGVANKCIAGRAVVIGMKEADTEVIGYIIDFVAESASADTGAAVIHGYNVTEIASAGSTSAYDAQVAGAADGSNYGRIEIQVKGEADVSWSASIQTAEVVVSS